MTDEFCLFESPNGWLCIKASRNGVTEISLAESQTEPVKKTTNPILRLCRRELSEYFDKRRTAFTVPLDLRGTGFQLRVWRSLARIPYGGTTTYGDIARVSGYPQAYQAVGQIVGNNPIPVILACHRVLGSGGRLTGFGWGIAWKIWLRRLENAEMSFL